MDLSEFDFLRRCLSARGPIQFDPGPRGWTSVDWDALAHQARLHEVEPLVYRCLQPFEDHVPVAVVASLRTAFDGVAKRNDALYAHLGRLMDRLAQEGIPVVGLKGSYLADAVYPERALRHMEDLDVLVPRGDLHTVERVGLELGFHHQEGDWRPIETCCAVNLHITPLRIDDDLSIDIHWTIEQPQSPIRIRPDDLWSNLRPARIAGRDAFVLAPELFLLHLCLHIAYHHGFDVTLRHLGDLHWFVRSKEGQLGWERVLEWAEHWGALRFVYPTLAVADRLLGSAVPSEVLEAMCTHPEDREMLPVLERHILMRTPKRSEPWTQTQLPITRWLQRITGYSRRDGTLPAAGQA